MTATRVISTQTADELIEIIEELKNEKLQLLRDKTALMEEKLWLVKKLTNARNGLYVLKFGLKEGDLVPIEHLRRTVSLTLDQLR